MTQPEPPPENRPSDQTHSPFGLRPARTSDRVSALQFLPLYCVVGLMLFFLLRAAVAYLIPPSTPRLWGVLLVEIIFAVSALAPAVAISVIERASFADYGLPAHHAFGRLFWQGVLCGLISLSLLLLVLHLAGALSYGGVAVHGNRIWKFALFWALFFLAVAIFEEFAFRGYTLFVLRQVAGFWPAAFFLSAIFAFIHHYNSGETWSGALGAGAVGLFFCFTLRRTGNLWFAVGMHAAWDWAQTFLYGVPDSGVVEPGHLLKSSLYGPAWLTGGTVGPEGSLLLFALIAVLWIAFDRLYPPTPPQKRSAL